MRIVIIEDEKLTAEDLSDTLQKVIPYVQILAVLNSVSNAIEWFSKNDQPDLIFSDVQLGDGLCFEIFKVVPALAPVIFCTAYDKYALEAFDANGIDYILKPFDDNNIREAITKYERLKETLAGNNSNIEQLIQFYEKRKKPSGGAVLVYKQDKIVPVSFNDIALFYIENEITYLLTFDHKQYMVNHTIEHMDSTSPGEFFRVNRQTIVNRKAIREASRYFARKLSLSLIVPFNDTITVSKNKVTDFLEWLASS